MAKGNIIQLTVAHPEGLRTQRRGWNRLTGETLESFELLNSTLERRSLLHKGKNRIEFQVLQNTEVITSGAFEVTVNEKTEKCNTRYLGRSHAADYYRCIRDPRICREYLEDFAVCHSE